MTTPARPGLAAMMTAAEFEWRANAPEDWTTIDFRQWPRGFHRSAWVVAGYIGWNPLDVLDAPTPAARAVKGLSQGNRIGRKESGIRHAGSTGASILTG